MNALEYQTQVEEKMQGTLVDGAYEFSEHLDISKDVAYNIMVVTICNLLAQDKILLK